MEHDPTHNDTQRKEGNDPSPVVTAVTIVACDSCGTTEAETQYSDALNVTLCGACFTQLADDSNRQQLPGLLDAIGTVLRRFVVLGDSESVAITLFVAHTWAFAAAYATPYLLVLSPEKRSGKSLLLEVLELVCARPWRVAGASEAAMFRKLASERPTLLLDEIDAVFGADSQRTEPLRGILNAGNRSGGSVARCVGPKHDQVADFEVFSPKVLAGIDTGRLPDTIRDRSILIAMKRRTQGEYVERFRFRTAQGELRGLRLDLEEWSERAADELRAVEPDLPEALDDRAAEAWEPLLAIADQAGGEWPNAARDAAHALSAGGENETSRGAALLGAIRTAFGDRDRMSTADLLPYINANEELPFGGWSDGKGLDGRTLARLLKPYAVSPRTIRLDDGSTAKGYPREALVEAWKRWLPITPPEPSQASQPSHASRSLTEKPQGRAPVTPVTPVTAIAEGVPPVTDISPNGTSHDAVDESFSERCAREGLTAQPYFLRRDSEPQIKPPIKPPPKPQTTPAPKSDHQRERIDRLRQLLTN